MWMKIDDRLHAHRKTRSLTRSHPQKRLDAAPMGLWVLAGSWASQNATRGWVPESEMDRWEDDWQPLARRLVHAGYWWPESHEGEPGYGFNDWEEWNGLGASASGRFGNHVRWHVDKGVVKPECEHCPTEPDEPEEPEPTPVLSPRVAPDIAPDVAPDSGNPIGANRLPVPNPTPIPTRPDPETSSSDKPDQPNPLDRFDEFWDTYAKKVKRADAERKWVKALKKPGITADLLIAAARDYVTWERANNEGGRFIADPSTWLHGERWTDERVARQPQQHQGRASQWLQLAADLGDDTPPANVREIGPRR